MNPDEKLELEAINLREQIAIAIKALEHIANGGERPEYVARLNLSLLKNTQKKL